MTYNRRILVILAAGAALLSPAVAQEPARVPGRISVVGEGKAAAVPDMAVFDAGIVVIAETAQAALEQNTKSITALLAALKAAGIDGRDLATSGFAVQPRVVYSQAEPGKQPEQPNLEGYEVRNSVTAKIRDLSKLGTMLDAAVQHGANQIGAISFDIQNKDALLDKARQDAINDAKRKAEKAAQAAGLKLSRVLSLSESVQHQLPRPMAGDGMSLRGAGAPVPVEPGEQSLGTHVEMTWEIAN
jgi:uncharacterized protein YggE